MFLPPNWAGTQIGESKYRGNDRIYDKTASFYRISAYYILQRNSNKVQRIKNIYCDILYPDWLKTNHSKLYRRL